MPGASCEGMLTLDSNTGDWEHWRSHTGGLEQGKLTFSQIDADIVQEGLDGLLRLKEVVNSKHASDAVILQLFPPLLLAQHGCVLKVSLYIRPCKERTGLWLHVVLQEKPSVKTE
jgi:hypothetical protein